MEESRAITVFETEIDIVEFSETAIEPFEKLPDLLDYSQKLTALYQYAKASKKDAEVRNKIVACDALARRKAGAILADPGFERYRGGDHGSNKLLLRDFSLDKMEARRLMLLSKIPWNKWVDYIRSVENSVLTYIGFYNLARKLTTPPKIEDKYDVIVLDPPWPGRKIIREIRPNQEREYEYPEMTLEEISNLELPSTEDCHVFLWITNKLLPRGFEIFERWAVRYTCTLTWHKPGGYQPYGLPQYNCEYALYGRIGKPIFIDTKQFNLCFEAPRGRHSEKPDYFFEVIARATTGQRISMYERKERNGFDSWGNEI